MIKKLYVIRHGETAYNHNGIVQGRKIDADLNEKGREQADSFYNKYKAFDFDVCFTSTLKRTHQTVDGFLKDGLQWYQFSGLDEMNYGEFEGKQAGNGEEGSAVELMNKWNDGFLNLKPEGGEGPYDVMKRQQEAFSDILGMNFNNALVCMHSRAIRIMLCWMQDLNMIEMKNLGSVNTGLSIISYDPKAEKYTLEEFNNTDHL
ncbi:histidine phosphatase family protein [Aureibacter tunicatorum]|uniref:Phosphoglycerate mutase n=1 Tax=Aureibacter tunicatorum TaxID=866807 RepID=A0AAE3XPJ9_9BACT|nr:histidine phosphatase family protein [Aureibacter tunicatorum]MDR6239596.1 putative phosphoglycerate mutase [Aureibacter tunicatorum]BDD04073.1 phosphoglycerate mutase [Aureibacter tunicatorum]